MWLYISKNTHILINSLNKKSSLINQHNYTHKYTELNYEQFYWMYHVFLAGTSELWLDVDLLSVVSLWNNYAICDSKDSKKKWIELIYTYLANDLVSLAVFTRKFMVYVH